MTGEPQTLGLLPNGAVTMRVLPEVPAEIIEGFRALPDLTGMSSDAMDLIGIAGAIPAALLRPTDAAARLVGRALTVRNVRATRPVDELVKQGVSRLGEIEAHNLAQPGDVLVLQGIDAISNMGSISASIGRRQGEVGAIVDGAVRDIDHSRAIGYPIWSRSVSPVTGKWRIETIAVNTPVTICGVSVEPGDIVLADEVGVCFVPLARAREVLERARKIAANEEARQASISAGTPVADLAQRRPRSKTQR